MMDVAKVVARAPFAELVSQLPRDSEMVLAAFDSVFVRFQRFVSVDKNVICKMIAGERMQLLPCWLNYGGIR